MDDVLYGWAENVAEELERRAIRTFNGTTWIEKVVAKDGRMLGEYPLAYDLYHGCGGVALFLSALYALKRADRWRKLSLAAIRPLRRDVHRRFYIPAKETPVGAAVGWGSVIYALVKISHFLDCPDLLEDAEYFSALVSPHSIDDDPYLDVFRGAAGLILGLTKLHETTRSSEALDKARRAGANLVRRIEDADGSKTTAGFAHGTAGIAYALFRLHQATKEAEWKRWAARTLSRERDRRAGNGTGWCRGPAGIGFACLGSYAVDPRKVWLREVRRCVTCVQHAHDNHNDTYCCGNLGHAELIFTAGLKMNDPQLQAMGRQRFMKLASRLMADDDDGQVRFVRHIKRYGLFVGWAGWGYQLLRTAAPQTVPSVLLWE